MQYFMNVLDPAHLLFWVTPNDMRQTPRVRIILDRGAAIEIEASVEFANIKEWGWHATGLCGFDVTEAICPGLGAASHVEIYDCETNFLLYRRIPAPQKDVRLLGLDYTIGQENPLRDALFGQFQISYFGVQSIPHELLRCVIDLHYTESLFVYGGVLYQRYEEVLRQRNYLRTILIADPYIELARRILWLRRAAEAAQDEAQRWRTEHIREPCQFAADLDLGNVSALRKAFARIDVPTFQWLANPLTRHLGSSLPDEVLRPEHWQAAIQNLSRFDVVGHRGFWDAYAATMLDVLGLDIAPPPERPVPEEVTALANALAGLSAVSDLVEMDFDLSDKVYSAVEKQWAVGPAA
ncbi:hypothetical protein [Methylobacterium isbiliense]|jgi:hypothetical protein|uniref:Uncharacterized protein n=1 Tax=Methylobacterium isbiliense TaxID=315478 RepID=A0ABQ4SDK3_9HYPH|nr:hypothetical protein [Methylobacterium isbiliense]MDN3625558.1 hypothetical protein [Methylobacterium isbiliense]GJD99992.1 hypothetical protein GMJLKIPL_1910 [Methylobacterium isbiliense]